MVIIPGYLPPISFFKKIINLKTIYLCKSSSYQKQTYRNRCIISTSNGIQKLTVPIRHNNKNKSYFGTQIYNEITWQKNHWKAIESAYNSSPFFKYYFDDFFPFYKKKYKFLFDYNYEMLIHVFKLMELNIIVKNYEITEDYLEINKLLNPKKKREEFKSYSQVFSNKNGFQSDLSIIDLIFNLGPETNEYLNSI